MESSLPSLKKFYETHKDQRDKFEIIAFSGSSAGTMAELEKQMKPYEEKNWGGPLPFPILLDQTGKTWKAWGIIALPRFVLIDPDGNVVRGASEAALEKILKAEEEKTK